MKIRVRLQNRRTERIELDGDGTFGNLKTAIVETFGLDPGTFNLSLNGRDALEGTDETSLSTFDIVSGDLIRVLSDDHHPSPPPPPSNQEQNARNPPRQPPSSTPSHNSGIKSSSINSHPLDMTTPFDKDTPSTSREQTRPKLKPECKDSEDAKADLAPRLAEPMLCREATDTSMPLRLRQLLHQWQPSNQCQTLSIALHVLMLETGFVAVSQCQKTNQGHQSAEKDPEQKKHKPEDGGAEYAVHDDTSAMPADWKDSQSVYKIRYTHPMCETAECSVAWVPLGSVLMVHAISNNGQNHFQLQLSASAFVVKSSSSISPDRVPYKQLTSLSRQYKDEIAHPLLEAMRAELGLAPLHGLMALVPEIQLLILSYLDLRSLVRISEVCTHFHSISGDMSLWRQLVIRNFGGRITDANTNWRELYKQKYLARREMEQARSRFLASEHVPPFALPYKMYRGLVPPLPHPLHPMYPPGYRGGDYDLDPRLLLIDNNFDDMP